MKSTKTKIIYWALKIMSVVVSCAFPIYTILERFPIWVEVHGTSRSVGTGGILIVFVVLVIFRKSVFDFMRDRLNLRHAPPLFGWLIMIAASYALLFVSKFLYDITAVCWMGLVGCAIGALMTFIAENFCRVKEKSDG